MREKAKKILLALKAKNKELSAAFDSYVKQLSEELEIEERIAVTLVTDELVNRNQKQLILSELFSKSTLKNFKK